MFKHCLRLILILLCLAILQLLIPFQSLAQTGEFDYLINSAEFTFSSDEVNNQELINTQVSEDIVPNSSLSGKDLVWSFPLLSYPFQDPQHFKILNSDQALVNQTLKITTSDNQSIQGIPSWDKFGQTFSIRIITSRLSSQPKLIHLRFTTRSLAYQLGRVTNFNLPFSADNWSFENSSIIKVATPNLADLGTYFINPTPNRQTQDQTQHLTIYQYSGSSIKNSGLQVQFGSTQEYHFSISATLPTISNAWPILSSFQKRLFRLTLPTSQDQDVAYMTASPKPNYFYPEPDGNGVVAYYLLPMTQTKIDIEGIVTLLPSNINTNEYLRNALDQATVSTLPQIQENHPEDLAADHYIDKDNPAIVQVAKQLMENQSNVYRIVKNDYQFVVSKIQYNDATFYQLQRNDDANSITIQTASQTLKSGKGICSEYAFLLAAILRAQGIPAKFVAGASAWPSVALPDLHAWVNALLPNVGWIPLDPTWGNERRDFIGQDLDHLTLYQTAIGNANADLWQTIYPDQSWNKQQTDQYLASIDNSYQFNMEPITSNTTEDISVLNHRLDLFDNDNTLTDQQNTYLESILASHPTNFEFFLTTLIPTANIKLVILVLLAIILVLVGLTIIIVKYVFRKLEQKKLNQEEFLEKARRF